MSSDAGYKVCPSCREEYTLVVDQCVHCNTDLVSPDELAEDDAGDQEDFPPASELVYLRVAPISWIRALSEALEQAELPHRVEPAGVKNPPGDQRPEAFGEVDLFGMYVLPSDETSAKEIDGNIASQILPEEAQELEEGEQDECPACGAALDSDTTVCPDCELPLA